MKLLLISINFLNAQRFVVSLEFLTKQIPIIALYMLHRPECVDNPLNITLYTTENFSSCF